MKPAYGHQQRGKLIMMTMLLAIFITFPAGAVTVNFTGEVTAPIGTLSTGTAAYGSFSYTIVPPVSSGPTSASYLSDMSFSLQVGSESLMMQTSDPLVSAYLLSVGDNLVISADPFDLFQAYISLDWHSPSLPALGGKDITGIKLYISDLAATMFSSTAIPTNFLFTTYADFMSIDMTYNPPTSSGGWPWGRIGNLQFTSVPEPASMLLLGLGLMGLVGVRMKFQK